MLPERWLVIFADEIPDPPFPVEDRWQWEYGRYHRRDIQMANCVLRQEPVRVGMPNRFAVKKNRWGGLFAESKDFVQFQSQFPSAQVIGARRGYDDCVVVMSDKDYVLLKMFYQ